MAARWDRSERTCGRPGIPDTATAAAVSNSGVPARRTSLWKTTARALGGRSSSAASRARARADSSESVENPPALSALAARGAARRGEVALLVGGAVGPAHLGTARAAGAVEGADANCCPVTFEIAIISDIKPELAVKPLIRSGILCVV